MLTRHQRLAIALLAVVTPCSPALAQSFQEWTACAPSNGFVFSRACFVTRLETSAILVGNVRTGTAVSLLLRDLQGSAAGNALGDNTPWSGIGDVTFFSALPVNDLPPYFGIAPALSGGATGSAVNGREFVLSSGAMVFSDNLLPRTTVGGCTARAGAMVNYAPTLFTCAANAWVSFSRNSSAIFDATDFSRFDAVVFEQAGANDVAAFCESPNPTPRLNCQLDITSYVGRSEPPVIASPEPTSVVLVASGLLLLLLPQMIRRLRKFSTVFTVRAIAPAETLRMATVE